MRVVEQRDPRLAIAPTCETVGLARATYYRGRMEKAAARSRASPRALSVPERQAVLEILHEPRFVDLPPEQVYATLLDEGLYLCSPRTMYRILAAQGEVRERRDQLHHPPYAVPRLLTTRPNELWSWDITKLLGPGRWTYYYLYVILDIFSRYVVGWMIAYRESAALAERLIRESCRRQGIARDQLTVHADRGPSMTSKPVAFLLADLGVRRTHSRPHVSNDNPYSEAQFKTLKYRPDFPDRFESFEHAHGFCASFFPWYNDEHHHCGLGYLTPRDVHFGLAAERLSRRAGVLAEAFQAHPERFPAGLPQPASPPSEVWINKPLPAPQPDAPAPSEEGAREPSEPERARRASGRPTSDGALQPPQGNCPNAGGLAAGSNPQLPLRQQDDRDLENPRPEGQAGPRSSILSDPRPAVLAKTPSTTLTDLVSAER